jgi:hypothetical protein
VCLSACLSNALADTNAAKAATAQAGAFLHDTLH